MIKHQPGCVYPDEYDFETQFNKLDTIHPFTSMDTGKILGLAIAYLQMKERCISLAQELEDVASDYHGGRV